MTATEKLKVLFEDNHLLVVLKEPDVLSQGDASGDPDMLGIAKEYIKNKYNKPGEVYLGLIHRLDRRVGGLMAFAKTSKAAGRLSREIRERQFKKEYVALVTGDAPVSGMLTDYLVKVKRRGRIVAEAASPEDRFAQKAVMNYRKIKTVRHDGKIFSVLLINLVTGRYNQIRKQLALAGHPIVGDFKYGYRGENYDDRLGLFCWRLVFKHPTANAIVDVKNLPSGWLWGNLEDDEFEHE
ncbi:MAG: RNA pseudouridine synthase [Bacillota bacterium]|nr:RNA pseudouridine synthase [Bacillota bacterium]